MQQHRMMWHLEEQTFIFISKSFMSHVVSYTWFSESFPVIRMKLQLNYAKNRLILEKLTCAKYWLFSSGKWQISILLKFYFNLIKFQRFSIQFFNTLWVELSLSNIFAIIDFGVLKANLCMLILTQVLFRACIWSNDVRLFFLTSLYV